MDWFIFTFDCIDTDAALSETQYIFVVPEDDTLPRELADRMAKRIAKLKEVNNYVVMRDTLSERLGKQFNNEAHNHWLYQSDYPNC